MPILHAAYKRIKRDRKRYLRNISLKSKLKTETKKFIGLLASKRIEEAKVFLRGLISEFDRAASKGIIHKNTASRKKARLSKRLQAALQSSAK